MLWYVCVIFVVYLGYICIYEQQAGNKRQQQRSGAAGGKSSAGGSKESGVDEVFLPKDDIEENDDDFEKELNEFKR